MSPLAWGVAIWFALQFPLAVALGKLLRRKTAPPGASAPAPAPGAAPTDPDLTKITRWRADI